MTQSKVLAIGFVDSVHVGKWLEAHAENIDFVVFPSGPNRRVDQKIRRLRRDGDVIFSNFEILVSPILSVWEIVFRNNVPRALLLARRIRLTKPDLIHIFETQHGGYAYSKAGQFLKSSPPRTMLTLFGSDLFWFRKFRKHRKLLANLLAQINYLHIECKRDIAFAKELGFQGEFLGPYPASGVLPQYPASIEKNLGRDIVLAKGYAGNFGGGHEVLKAVRILNRRNRLDGLRVIFYSAGIWLSIKCWLFRVFMGVPVRSYIKFSLTSAQMTDLMLRSVVHVGVSRSDGFPAAVLEALHYGVLPIQSPSACLQESAISSKNYVTIPDHSPEGIARAVDTGIRIANTKVRPKGLESIWDQDFPRKVKRIYSSTG